MQTEDPQLPNSNAPIAIFDSGVGGLTVVAALRRLLPLEALVYLGDTARLPYGTKSPTVVQRYAQTCAQFLCGRSARLHAKLLVVACNTASAHALPTLQASLPIPVLGVIAPGAAAAARCSRNQVIGVIATEGTVQSGCYQRALHALLPACTVLTQPCPLLVPLAEENMVWHPATELIARDYLTPLLQKGIDTLVLGCTHYPLLAPLLQQICGPQIHIVDSAKAVAEAVGAALAEPPLRATQRHAADIFYATDISERLHRVGQAFLGTPMGQVTLVDIT
jgi:glutamate racemase